MNWAESYKYGESAEDRFADLLDNPVRATKNENIFEHWDISDNGVKYDVKAMKKFKRGDLNVTDRIHYIELKNVRGKDGWVYGKADYIAFETRAYWVIVSRQKLAESINLADMGRSTFPQVYKLYGRTGREDLMTLVPTVDLIAMSERMIKKVHE
jgi:DNA-binding Lrp family transcriptional regulator